MKIAIWCMASLLMSCAGARLPQSDRITPSDISKLDDPTKSYLYVGDYYYLPMRPGHGVGILEASIDSVSFAADSRLLCVGGQIAESLYQQRVENASVFIGTIQPLTWHIINDNAPPTPVSSYRIEAQHEVQADNNGRFHICGTITPESYLVIANQGDLLCLYHVGRIVGLPGTVNEDP